MCMSSKPDAWTLSQVISIVTGNFGEMEVL